MAKNELLENILDELSVLKEKDEARDQRLDRIEVTLGELVKAAGSTLPTTSTSKALSENIIPYDALKGAIRDGMTEYHETSPKHTDFLTEENIRKLHSVLNKADGEWLKKHWAKQDEEAKKKRDDHLKLDIKPEKFNWVSYKMFNCSIILRLLFRLLVIIIVTSLKFLFK